MSLWRMHPKVGTLTHQMIVVLSAYFAPMSKPLLFVSLVG